MQGVLTTEVAEDKRRSPSDDLLFFLVCFEFNHFRKAKKNWRFLGERV